MVNVMVKQTVFFFLDVENLPAIFIGDRQKHLLGRSADVLTKMLCWHQESEVTIGKLVREQKKQQQEPRLTAITTTIA